MNRSNIVVIGIDPGLTVGYMIGNGHDRYEGGAKPMDEFLAWFSTFLACGVASRAASERYDARRWDDETKMTVECIGAIRFLCRQSDTPLNEVNAADKKKVYKSSYAPLDIANKHTRDAEAVRLWDFKYGTWR